jgi:autotransporter-associated beta strand protein
LTFSGNSTLGDSANTVTLANNATLSFASNTTGLIQNKVLAVASSGGTLAVDSGSASFAGNGTLAGTLSIDTVASSSTLTLSGNLGGAGGLRKIDGGTLTITGGNSYGGGTEFNGGTLNLNSSSGYAVPGNLTYTGSATLNLNRGSESGGQSQIAPTAVVTFSDLVGYQFFNLIGHTVTVEGIEMTYPATAPNGQVAIQNNDPTNTTVGKLIIDSQNSHTFLGIIRDTANGGKLALVKRGPGTQTLLSADSGGYTGGLTVEAGTLDYSGGALPVGNYTVTGGTLNIGALKQSIGTFQITGGLVSAASTGSLTGNAVYDVQGGTVQAILAGTVGLTKTQAATAALQGANTYSGPTKITGGVLELDATGQINGSSPVTNDAILRIAGGSHTVGTIGGAGATEVLSGTLIATSMTQNALSNDGVTVLSGGGNIATISGTGTLNVTGGTLTAGSVVQGSLIIGTSGGGVASAAAGSPSAPVPEPGTWLLALIGVVGWCGLRRLYSR